MRYQRQELVLGKKAQEKLRSSTAAVFGLGGLGCAAATYLAAAGVNLLLIDPDVVEESNLARQVLYVPGDIGKNKAEVASKRLSAQNPDVQITLQKEPHEFRADVLVDCTDSNKTRFGLNQLARTEGVPYIYGACSGWTGAVATLLPKGPCLRCLLEGKSSQITGAFGPIVGTTGSLQALFAVVALTSPSNCWLHFDAEKLDFAKVKLPESCAHC